MIVIRMSGQKEFQNNAEYLNWLWSLFKEPRIIILIRHHLFNEQARHFTEHGVFFHMKVV